MNMTIENLKSLINDLKTTGVFTRLFGWKAIRIRLVDAAADLQRLISLNETLQADKQKLETELSLTTKDLGHSINSVNLQKVDLGIATDKIASLHAQHAALNEKYNKLLAAEEIRKQEHAKAIATLVDIRQSVEKERRQETDKLHQAEIERLTKMKETWNRHEEQVMQSIKAITSRHIIEYVAEVPFAGEPDNTIKLCGEFIVFDAKSPGGEDLKNFSSYLKDQAERAKKYAKQENVKSDIFFVVPSNTLEIIKTHVHRMGDYTVYVIAIDALEPILLNLKKVEDYEYVKELSPEDRENICRIIGKFGHLSKRRVQVDNFFARQFIQLAYKCEADLPGDMLEKAFEFEKSEKLNPPVEKRAKAINLKELGNEIARLKEDAAAKGIVINDNAVSSRLNELPLYNEGENQ